MASSLASQLYQMQNVDRIISTERAQRIRASFLFDGRQAADMDNQTIFDIGRSGLDELRKISHKFDVYADTLFSEAVKDLDRVLQTKDENKKLDQTIRAFLFQLAPHFLTKPAGKTIEWLIRRFRIQEFNAKDVLAAIIPYHETKAFLSLLTIITFDTQDMGVFGFLVTQRKARRLLDRATLMAQCVRDRSLMSFVCNSVFSAVKSGFGYPGLHSFYAMTMSQYIGQLHAIDDNAIQFVLPYVLDGLAHDSKDVQIAAYMVLGSLATRVTFTQDALEQALCAVAKHPVDISAMALCLVQLLQSQVSADSLTVSFPCLKLLAKQDAFICSLCDIAKKYDIEHVMHVITSALVRYASSDEKVMKLLLALVSNTPSSCVDLLCKCAVDECISITLGSGDMDRLSKVLDLIHLRYSQQLEDAIGAAANSIAIRSDLNKEQKETVHKMLYSVKLRVSANGVSGLLPLRETSTTLYLSINHAEASIRLIAAKALRDIATGKNLEFSIPDKDISDLIFERLQHEDDERVLDIILSLPVANYILPDSLVSALIGIIENGRVSITGLCDKIISNLFAIDCSDMHVYNQIASAILPYVFVFEATKSVSESVFLHLGSSNFGQQSSGWLTCLASLDAKSKPINASGDHNQKVTSLLANELFRQWNTTTSSSFAVWSLQILPTATLKARIVALFVGAHAACLLAKTKDNADSYVDATSRVASTALDILSSSSFGPGRSFEKWTGISSTDDSIWNDLLAWLSETNGGFEIAASGVAIATFSLVIGLLPSTLKLEANMWFGSATTFNDSKSRCRELLRTIFVLIASRSSELRSFDGILIGRLLGACVGDEWAEFLASIWLSDVDSLVRSRCLLAFKALVQHRTASNETASNIDYQVVLPSIIAMMSDTDPRVRSSAVACIKSLKSLHPVFLDKKQKQYVSKKKPASQQDIYKYDEFYGQTSCKLQYLSLETESRFIHLLSMCADEISGDSLAVKAELGSILNKGVTSSTDNNESRHGSHLKLNSQGRETVVAYLLSHIAATDNLVPELQVRLLGMLESVVSVLFLEQLSPLISGHAKQLELAPYLPQRNDTEDTLIRRLFALCYSPTTAKQLMEKASSKYWNEFLNSIAGVTQQQGSQTEGWTRKEYAQAYIQQVAFECLGSNFSSSLGPQAVSSVTTSLFGVAARGNSYFLPESSSISLRQIYSLVPLDPNVAADEISTIAEKLTIDDSDSSRSTKRHKGPRSAEGSLLVLPELATLLEFVQCSPQLSTEPLLVPSLFALLSVFVSDLSPSSS
ncbi:snoRNA-binding rRNA-processing protein utp10, partial [Coemansia sp. RSA 1285]